MTAGWTSRFSRKWEILYTKNRAKIKKITEESIRQKQNRVNRHKTPHRQSGNAVLLNCVRWWSGSLTRIRTTAIRFWSVRWKIIRIWWRWSAVFWMSMLVRCFWSTETGKWTVAMADSFRQRPGKRRCRRLFLALKNIWVLGWSKGLAPNMQNGSCRSSEQRRSLWLRPMSSGWGKWRESEKSVSARLQRAGKSKKRLKMSCCFCRIMGLALPLQQRSTSNTAMKVSIRSGKIHFGWQMISGGSALKQRMGLHRSWDLEKKPLCVFEAVLCIH